MLTPDKVKKLYGLDIQEYYLTNHNPNKIDLPGYRSKPLIAITVHNTNDLLKVYDDAEQYTRATVNGNMKTVRPNAYLDDVNIWQLLPWNYINWTNTDGKGPGNTQTISIECIMGSKSKAEDIKAEDNCARLVAALQLQNGLKPEDVVTHTYWLHVRDGHTKVSDRKNWDRWSTTPHPYKTCPYYIISHWMEFKAKVKKYYDQYAGIKTEDIDDNNSFQPYTVKIICNKLNIRSAPGTGPNSKVVGILRKKPTLYTIVEEKKVGKIPWGRLRSGAGWISLLPKYVQKS